MSFSNEERQNFRNCAETIMCTFRWADMPEGSTFWLEVHDKLVDFGGSDRGCVVSLNKAAAIIDKQLVWLNQSNPEMWHKAYIRLLNVPENALIRRATSSSTVITPQPMTTPKGEKKKGEKYPSRDDYAAALVKRGWYSIGFGHFSSVYAHDKKKYVIKIGNKDSWGNFDGGFVFAEFAKAHPNPHFPVIHALFKRDEYYVVFMETLREYFKYRNEQNEEEYETARTTLYSTSSRDFFNLFDISPSLAASIQALKFEFEGKFSYDLHEQNIMIRGTSTLVITDPISFKSR
jgi:hypothetical protein